MDLKFFLLLILSLLTCDKALSLLEKINNTSSSIGTKQNNQSEQMKRQLKLRARKCERICAQTRTITFDYWSTMDDNRCFERGWEFWTKQMNETHLMGIDPLRRWWRLLVYCCGFAAWHSAGGYGGARCTGYIQRWLGFFGTHRRLTGTASAGWHFALLT